MKKLYCILLLSSIGRLSNRLWGRLNPAGKKTTLLVFCSVFFFINSFSQPVIEWQNTIGGSADDYPSAVYQTSDGGYILAGGSSSNISGDKTENSNGSRDYWIVKTDASGNIQWQNTIGGSSYEALMSIQQTSDGGYILGGFSTSNISGDKTENCLGGRDYWLVKISSSGNVMWQNTIGGDDEDELFSVRQTSDNGYILGGFSISNISGDKTENGIGNIDYWIVKTDATGNIQWQNTIGGTGYEEFHCLRQTMDGGYIIAGFSTSNISGDKTENSIGSNDYWIVKLDASGNIQWQNTIGGSGNDELYSIEQTSDGGFIIGGLSNSNISGDKTENGLGYDDYWIVKTDASGNIEWDNTIGGNSDDWRGHVVQTSDDGYLVGGVSASNISGDKTENNIGSFDFWIVKTDGLGNVLWDNTIGGTGNDYNYSFWQATDGGYMLGGASESNISGDKTENTNGGYDYWMVKLAPDFSTGTIEASQTSSPINATEIFPNPSTGILNAKCKTQNAELSIYNSLGESVYSMPLQTGSNEFDLTSAGKGIYFLQVKAGSTIETKRVVVIK
jgi:hypothetical protein